MRDAARFAPDTLSYRRAYLDLLVRHGGKEELRAALTAATPLAMDDVVWRVALAQHWSRLGDDAIAESVLQLALERAPDSTLCRTNLAAVRRRRAMTGPMTGPMTRPMTRPGAPQAGDTAASPVADESAADPQGALRAELSRLAQQLSASGDAAGAGAFLEVASDQRTTEAELRRSTMELLEKTGEFTRAAEEAALLLKHAPLDASVHLSLGRCLLRAGQPGPAEQALRRSLRLSPADDAAGHLLAACLEQTGRNDEARAVLEAAIAQQPDNPHRVARYGHHLTSRGDLGAAETAFRRAVSLSPKEASLHLALADLLARRHDWAEAVKEAREATTLDPDHGTAQSLFGRLLDIEVQRLAREAEGAMRRALALQPDDMECVIQLADLLHRSSRMDEAAGLVRSALVRTPADARLLAKMEQLSAASGLPDADRAEAGAAEAAMEVRAQATEDTGDPVPAQALAEPSATDGLPKTGRVPGAGLLRRILQG